MSEVGRRVDVVLVVGGKYHDFDYARLELLKLLAEHDELRVRVQPDYEDTSGLDAATILVSYTCDVRPALAAQERIRSWVEGGGRWLALHGTNAAMGDVTQRPIEVPRPFPLWVDTLGSQFLSHPTIAPFRVDVTDPDHWLVAGIEPFDVTEELYLCSYPDRAVLVPLLHTTWNGSAPSFEHDHWQDDDPRRLVMYLRPLGRGGVLYNALGHCRGHYDMVPVKDWWPTIDRWPWELEVFHELLRRSVRWAMGADS
jgi:type 1 glutamine amidotransferase